MKDKSRSKWMFLILPLIVAAIIVGWLEGYGLFEIYVAPPQPVISGEVRRFSDYNKIALGDLARIEISNAGTPLIPPWSVQLERPDLDSPVWIFARDTYGNIPGDQTTDGEFILSLLQSISSRKAVQASLEVGKMSPESLGLQPPKVQIKLWNSTQPEAKPVYELHLGSPADNTAEALYAREPDALPVVFQGKIAQLLKEMIRADRLSSPYWVGLATSDLDEIEEITWRRGRHVYFIAHRSGSGWTDRRFESTSKKISEWLEKMANSRFRRRVESVELGQTYKKALLKSADLEISIRDRSGRQIQLRLGRVQDRIIGISSFRPQGVFELTSETLMSFRVP